MNHPIPSGPGPSFSPDETVTCRCEAEVLLDGPISLPVTLAFRYVADEPYSVRMAVHTDSAPPVEWVFARNLLMEGLRRPAGLGDVQVWPVPRRAHQLEAGGGAVHIRISSPDGTTVLSMPARPLRGFVERSLEEVPSGAETDRLHVDESLSAWVAEGRTEDGTL
ncbi:SsgA family sporulation/cell division regulator [Streptomyces sp. NPDC086783]|uniref:SsgA family sporulation/cell division regulator n=1 Tax=Streptomyces sp. NPDC086783 TaxID=3365758 RepID=UPI00382853EF